MIVVMGATGNTGRKITETLLRRGARVRALGRSQAKVAPLARAGAEVRVGDVADLDFLAGAFRGADAAYTLLPTDRRSPDYRARQRQEGEAIAEAVRRSGIRHVVALSSLGAELPDGTGLITGLHEQEERLRSIGGVNLLLLRPVSFFENFREQLPVIGQLGALADSVAPDLAIPMVATRDIADVAAAALVDRDWVGARVRELLGPRDLSHVQVARILGRHLGKPDLHYVRLSDAEMIGALLEGGFSESFATLYVEMTRAFNEGRVKPRAGRTQENTTPTEFEDVVRQWTSAPEADPAEPAPMLGEAAARAN